jgi:hypothetical protein
MKSRVHPKYKTKYRVGNWAEYDRALVQRGDITLWLTTGAIAAWKPAPSGRRGGQRKFSDHAIETALMLRLVFKLPLRQAEGFLRSVLAGTLTRGSDDDAKTALDLIASIEGDIESLTADAAYDTLAIYDASAARGTEVIIRPSRSATRSR